MATAAAGVAGDAGVKPGEAAVGVGVPPIKSTVVARAKAAATSAGPAVFGGEAAGMAFGAAGASDGRGASTSTLGSGAGAA